MIRISTIARIIEDAAISTASNVARRTKSAVHATSIEYQARMMARAQTAVAKQQIAWRNMSKDERAEASRDTNTIQARAAELIAERKQPRYKHMRSDAEPSVVRDAKRTAKRSSNVKRAAVKK